MKSWGWYVFVGVVLIVTGFFAIRYEGLATLATVVAFGCVLFVAGIAQIIGAFAARDGGHIVVTLLVGILDAIVGAMIMQHPGVGALTLTLFIAALLVFGGIFRFLAAFWLQFTNFEWVALGSLITLILGVLLWVQWPISAVWFIGFAVGLNLIFGGVTWASFGLSLRNAATTSPT